jgi:hypothetical protein
MTKRDHMDAYTRLRKHGMTERLLAMQMGLTPDDIKEFEAARNALPLKKPQPEGYLIPGETDQKWSNKVKTIVYYSCGGNEKTRPIIQLDDNVAKAFGSNLVRLAPTKDRKDAGLAVHNNPLLDITWDPTTREVYITPSKDDKGSSLGVCDSGLLPWRVNALLELNMPDSQSEKIEADLLDNILFFKLPENLKPGKLSPRGKKEEPVVWVDAVTQKLDRILEILEDRDDENRIWEPSDPHPPSSVSYIRAAFNALPEGFQLFLQVPGHGMQPLGHPDMVRLVRVE